jgi:hypothetical protein
MEFANAVRETGLPAVPDVGAVSVTVGGTSFTLTTTVEVPVLPAASVAVRVAV